MDWVDFKIHIRKYREPYIDGYEYISKLFFNALYYYSKYRSSSIEGHSEYVYIVYHAWFLYYFAELENMLVNYMPERDEIEDNDWGMTSEAVRSLKDYCCHNGSGESLVMSCKSWVRSYYGLVRTSRVFNPAITEAIRLLQDKHGN